MLDRKALAEAARYTDAQIEEHGFEHWVIHNNIDLAALNYVADQRALRAALLLSGRDPRELPVDRMADVADTLTPESRRLMTYFASCVMDGIAIGLTAKNIRDYGQGKKTGG